MVGSAIRYIPPLSNVDVQTGLVPSSLAALERLYSDLLLVVHFLGR